MNKFPFSEEELKFTDRRPNFMAPDQPGAPLYRHPISNREAMHLAYGHKALWIPTDLETGLFSPRVLPDNIARGFVFEKNMMSAEQYGGKDMFGVEWVFVPVAGGSMEKPGAPHLLEDANDWKEKIVFPDVDSYDWDTSARENKAFLDNGNCNMFWFLNGAGFERLISFFGFEGAAMALVDEEQEDALKELLTKLTDLYIHLVDIACEAYGDGIDGFTYHDDWGSQRAPFFSKEVAKEFFVPQMRRLTDHIRAKGKIADLHSCGHIEAQIENIIAGGWQSWTPMPMNDTRALYRNYGDKIMIGVCDDVFPEGYTPEQQRVQAERFVKEYYSPSKPSSFSLYAAGCLTDAYREGLYRTSRQMA